MIGTLPLLTPDPGRSERTIARCHKRLARCQKRGVSNTGRADTTYLVLERALIGGLCVIYISGVAAVTIQVLLAG